MAETKRASLKGRNVFIAVPTHDGRLNIKTSFGLAKFMTDAMRMGFSVHLGEVSNCSLITMARNSLVNEFLKTDCTELLFIDSDVVVEPDNILRLMAQSEGKDVTAGAYPRRAWDKKFFADLYYDDKGEFEFDGSLMRVQRVGTGFMLIQRHVIEKLKADHPEWLYSKEDGGETVCALFDFAIKDGRYIGEDYLFCDRVTDAGMKVHLDVQLSLPHVGVETFERDFYEDAIKPLLEAVQKSKLKVVNG
jgi:hypothetical protein